MLTLLKDLQCFSPKPLGIRDILILKDIIFKISAPGELRDKYQFCRVIDCEGLTAFPGIVDGHVHITGGGGEAGPASRIGELDIAEIVSAGVTTVVGLLGADRQTKGLRALHAKAKALQAEGITTYIYSGSYEVPPVTFTGDITSDIVLIEKVVGVGEIAISDLRSSHAGVQQLISLSSAVYMGGLISGKRALVHLHLGDGKCGLNILNKILDKSDLPRDLFLPTHINRNRELFNQGTEYVLSGGNIDLTAGEEIGLPVPHAVEKLIQSGADMGRVTVSSDGNAGGPKGVKCKIESLYHDLVKCLRAAADIPAVVSLFTANPALRLGLYPRKGILAPGSDADIFITDTQFKLCKVFAMGRQIFGESGYITPKL